VSLETKIADISTRCSGLLGYKLVKEPYSPTPKVTARIASMQETAEKPSLWVNLSPCQSQSAERSAG